MEFTRVLGSIMRALEHFHEHLNNAKHLLILYEILHSNRQRALRIERKESLAKTLRKPVHDLKDVVDNEVLIILLLNHPNSPDRSFFKKDQLIFLVRQALVVGCSALDHFFQELYSENCYKVYSLIEKRVTSLKKQKRAGANVDEKISKLKKSKIFQQPLTIRHYYAITQYGGERKGHAIKGAILSSKRGRSVQSPKDASDLFKNIDLEIWPAIAKGMNKKKTEITTRLDNIIARRNQIIHTGDRPIRNRRPAKNPEGIDSDWVKREIEFIEKIALTAKGCVEYHASHIVQYLLEKE